MDTIDIDLPALRPEDVCADPREVIARATSNPRARRSKAESSLVSGAIIQDGWWTDEQVVLVLSNGTRLRIYLDGEMVEWSITASANARAVGEVSRVGAPPVITRWPRVGAATWDRSRLLSDRIGRHITMIFANGPFFLYTEGTRILEFSRVRQLPGARGLLYWAETD